MGISDFSLCSLEVKKAICELANVKWIDFKNDWFYQCINLFEKDIEKYDLGQRSFLYDGAKYLQYALEFADKKIDNTDPFVFEPLFKNSKHNSSITLYINEYLYHFGEHESMYRPIDLVWAEKDLFNCSLDEMTFWVMRMIISCIYQMPQGEYHEHLFIEEFNVETYEDMFYYTLLELYTRYGSKIV